jgi:hypothetical protein
MTKNTQHTEIDISVLLPTRGRPGPLEYCLQTLIGKAANPERIEVMIAFDDDDTDTIDYYIDVIQPYLESKKCMYTVMQFKRLGYLRLNEYLNELAKHSTGKWLFFWNDDAVMETQDWDNIIMEHRDEFALLRAETNHEHPYAIFPIMPRKWIEITGHLSPHQINDAWTSQIGWMLDIVKTIPVMINHERFDLTGKNDDDVFKNRPMLEGNPNNPRDFNSSHWRKVRLDEAMTIANWLDSQGYSTEHFSQALQGKHDIWYKMLATDKKNRLKSWKHND